MSYIGNSPGVASQRVTTTLTATAAQTQFTTQSGYVLGYVDVYLNGAKLVNGVDFEAITGTYITLFSGAAAGDVIELISYVPRGLSDGYTKAEADSKFLDVGGDTATGNLSFATATLSGNLTLNGGTANGVGYLNGSKVVTAGSALTFDGTVLAAPTLNLTNALGIAYGGTGQTTANAALNALLPTQTGNATKYLQTDGTNTTWDTISISTADITGTLPIANGGTGATTAAAALTSLGAYAASNPSGYTTNLGTVTSVGASVPAFLSVAGSPITTSGTLAISLSGTALPTTSGGTGLTAFTANGIAYASSTSALATGSALTFDGTNLGVTGVLNIDAADAAVGFRLRQNATIGAGTEFTATVTENTGVTFDSTDGGATARSFIWTQVGSEQMRLTSTGLGIGTNSPASKLQISDAASPNMRLHFTGAAAAGNKGILYFTHNRNSDSTQELLGYIQGVAEDNQSAGGIRFVARNNTDVEAMRITSAGNVGIGTTNASRKLTIDNSSTTNNTVTVELISPGTKSLYIGYDTDGTSATLYRIRTAGNIPLRFGNSADNNLLSLGNDGNVLIGTTATNTNSSKLVVNGTISQTVGGTQYLVVDQSDIGTAPNEIPLNQYLGNMAYADSANYYNTGMTTGFRNRIINGDMRIDQRNAGASVTTSVLQQGTFTLDRWSYYNDVVSKRTIQQSTIAPPGFKTSLKVTIIATDTSGPQQFLRQAIEGYTVEDLNWGTANAQSAVLSFWVRSSVIGQHGGAIQSNNTDQCFPFAYTINVADAWEYKTINIPGTTIGTWPTTNGHWGSIQFENGPGYQKSPANEWIALNATSSIGSVNLCATNGATWYITGVQFEKGTVATPFDVRPYIAELALCQRYYWKITGESTNTYPSVGAGGYITSTYFSAFVPYPVQMRATPTFSIGTGLFVNTVSYPAISSIAASYSSKNSGRVDFYTATSTAGFGGNVGLNADTASFIAASAEL